MLEQQGCPECKSQLIDDTHNGEVICSKCGIVVDDQIVYNGPDIISNNPEHRIKQSRATGHTTYSQHDLGITTEISSDTKDFSGKSLSPQMANHIQRIRTWQQRTRVSTPKEKRQVSVLKQMTSACNNLTLPKNVLETASILYRKMDAQTDIRGKTIVSITAAIIHMACKQCGIIRTLQEICQTMCSETDLEAKTKLAIRYYRVIALEIGQEKIPTISMSKHIAKMANMLNIDPKIERFALELASKTENPNMTSGKTPSGIAATYVYIATSLIGQSLLQMDVSNIPGVTEVTIRNRCKDILSNYKLKITLKPLNTEKY